MICSSLYVDLKIRCTNLSIMIRIIRFIFKQPQPCYRRYHKMEQFCKPCNCILQCKYPPPGPPVTLKIEARPGGGERIVRYDPRRS